MKLFEVILNGGLGNQLFQYATARALMKKSDLLLFNVNSYREDYLKRKFNLLNYNVRGFVTNNILLNKAFIPSTNVNIFLNHLSLYSLIEENGFIFHNELSPKTNFFTRILGFWQSELYFSKIRTELISELKPKEIPILPQIFTFPNVVAVHIRRTDYLTDLRYGFIGEDYYWKAINLIKQKVVNPFFVFFSDDMEWCKKTFNGDSMYFSDQFDCQEDYYHLYLMSKCNHQIIANSSFSWWGAWLNDYPNRLIIRPANPFNDHTLLHEKYYPASWISI
jgi:hypothetical protein